MKIPLMMIFQFFFIISAWATKALEDGKITAIEGLQLIIALAGILGVKPEFDISDFMPEVSVNQDKVDIAPDLHTPTFASREPAFPITKE